MKRQKRKRLPPAVAASVCPNCGYCDSCGRPARVIPYMVPCYPTSPYWIPPSPTWISTTPTWTTTGTDSSSISYRTYTTGTTTN